MAVTRLYEAEQSASEVGANSTTFSNGDLVVLSGWFVVKANATSTAPIVGVVNGTTVTSATNQTVEKVKVSYTRLEPYDTRFEFVPSAAIAATDIGKFYALTAWGLVDQTTGNVAKQAWSLVRLEGFLSTLKWVFVVVV